MREDDRGDGEGDGSVAKSSESDAEAVLTQVEKVAGEREGTGGGRVVEVGGRRGGGDGGGEEGGAGGRGGDRKVGSDGVRAASPRSGLPLFESEDGGIRSFDGKETYYMGIIDILQQYNGIKFVENFVMPLLRQEDAATLSAVPPDAYARRFYEYIRENSC